MNNVLADNKNHLSLQNIESALNKLHITPKPGRPSYITDDEFGKIMARAEARLRLRKPLDKEWLRDAINAVCYNK